MKPGCITALSCSTSFFFFFFCVLSFSNVADQLKSWIKISHASPPPHTHTAQVMIMRVTLSLAAIAFASLLANSEAGHFESIFDDDYDDFFGTLEAGESCRYDSTCESDACKGGTYDAPASGRCCKEEDPGCTSCSSDDGSCLACSSGGRLTNGGECAYPTYSSSRFNCSAGTTISGLANNVPGRITVYNYDKGYWITGTTAIQCDSECISNSNCMSFVFDVHTGYACAHLSLNALHDSCTIRGEHEVTPVYFSMHH